VADLQGVQVALLLAAGESRRMGQSKALLPWRGTTLLEYQVDALHSGGIQVVIVVLGHRAEGLKATVESKEWVTCVINPDYLQGKTTSIKAGLNALGQEALLALLILNVDQPRSPETIRHLLQQHQHGSFLITIPTYRGKGGHPIILDPSLLEELRLIREETLGIKAVTRRHQETTQRIEMENPEVLLDLNTPEEYRAALKI
jgi:molybdenum cofactor cytidylyltransferase